MEGVGGLVPSVGHGIVMVRRKVWAAICEDVDQLSVAVWIGKCRELTGLAVGDECCAMHEWGRDDRLGGVEDQRGASNDRATLFWALAIMVPRFGHFLSRRVSQATVRAMPWGNGVQMIVHVSKRDVGVLAFSH